MPPNATRPLPRLPLVPPTRRQTYRRRRLVVGAAALLVAAGAIYVPSTLLAPVSEVSASTLAPPVEAGESAQLVFPSSGAAAIASPAFDGSLATAGSTEPLPIASITKSIVALAALDERPLGPAESGPVITMTADDVAFYDFQVAQNGSVADVSAGLELTQLELLTVMLLPSANNYAQSLASWVWGDQASAMTAVNGWLGEHGFVGTTLTDPTGIEPTNVSTVTDLVGIATLISEEPTLSQIVATEAADIPGVGRVENTNVLLGIDGVDGIKTGTLVEAGSCLLFSTDLIVDGQTVPFVGVVLGGSSRAEVADAVTSLIDSAEAAVHPLPLVYAGEEFGGYETVWGDTAGIVAGDTASTLTWSDQPVTAEYRLDEISSVESGDTVGSITFSGGGREIVVPLEAEGTIDDPGFWWRLTHPGGL